MTWREIIALVLESAICAELMLFVVFLLSSPRRPPAVYLLAGLATCLSLMMAGNLLIGALGWLWLSDVVLFLDLLVPPTVYLYVLQMHHPARSLRISDLFHVAPALIGTLLWATGLLSSMDLYVNACWFGYLAFVSYYVLQHYQGYAPVARQHFLITLMLMLFAAGALRVVIVLQATGETSFREGLPYLFVLGVLFLLTCQILFTALRRPDLLSVPGSHLKYVQSTVDDSVLDQLDRQLTQILSEQKPYLDPDFDLTGLASLLGASPRHVSQLINARHEMNVSAYINFGD